MPHSRRDNGPVLPPYPSLADDMSNENDPSPDASESASIPEGDDAGLPADGVSSQNNPDGPGSDLPEELPPVKPPSGRFILQLFVVPALIVMAVIGVWALFGKLASSEQDWERLVESLRSPNKQIQWRAALGLAEMLRIDQQLGERGKKLTTNTAIASELTDLFQEQLRSPKENQENHFRELQFLARTLGYFDVPDIVLPALEEALKIEIKRDNSSAKQDESDPEDTPLTVKKNAIASVALIVNRANERGKPIQSDTLTQAVVETTYDDELLVRQLGTYALGLINDDAATARLKSLLRNPDDNTRVNAAVGLARRKLTDGWPVFREQFNTASEAIDESVLGPQNEPSLVNERYVWLAIATGLAFIAAIWSVATDSPKSRLIAGVFCFASLLGAGWCIYGVAEVRAEAEGPDAVARRETMDAIFRQSLVLRNSLKAVGDLKKQLSPGQMTEATEKITSIGEKHPLTEIRVEAKRVLGVLTTDSAEKKTASSKSGEKTP